MLKPGFLLPARTGPARPSLHPSKSGLIGRAMLRCAGCYLGMVVLAQVTVAQDPGIEYLPIVLATGAASWQVRGGVCPPQVVNCQPDPTRWAAAALVANPGSVIPQPGILPGVSWPVGPAAWVTKATDALGNVNSGSVRYDFGFHVYEFLVEFDLTGFPSSRLHLTGLAFADGELDAVTKAGLVTGAGQPGVSLNGSLFNDPTARPPGSWKDGQPFGFTTGFLPGINMLKIRVINRGLETGLRAERVRIHRHLTTTVDHR